MKQSDIFEAILDTGMKRGFLRYSEINDAFPPEMFPLAEMEDLMNMLSDIGVKIVDYEERIN